MSGRDPIGTAVRTFPPAQGPQFEVGVTSDFRPCLFTPSAPNKFHRLTLFLAFGIRWRPVDGRAPSWADRLNWIIAGVSLGSLVLTILALAAANIVAVCG